MDDTYTQRVAAMLQALMKKKGISQARLARVLGMSQQTVSRRVTGKLPLTTKEIETAAAFLGVPTGWLGDPPRNPTASDRRAA